MDWFLISQRTEREIHCWEQWRSCQWCISHRKEWTLMIGTNCATSDIKGPEIFGTFERMLWKVGRFNLFHLRSKPSSQNLHLSENRPKRISQHLTQEKEEWVINSLSHRKVELHMVNFRHIDGFLDQLYRFGAEASQTVGDITEKLYE